MFGKKKKSAMSAEEAFETAEKLHREGSKKALSYYEAAAEQGHGEAAYQLGKYYHHTKKNYGAALEWYEKAGALGSRDALWWAGTLYRDGKGCKQNYEKAFACFEKAAELGDPIAMSSCGDAYYYGDGVEKNLKKAFQWQEKSAICGYPGAFDSCARLCEEGIDGKPDLPYALRWYTRKWTELQTKMDEIVAMEDNDTEFSTYWLYKEEKAVNAHGNEILSTEKEIVRLRKKLNYAPEKIDPGDLLRLHVGFRFFASGLQEGEPLFQEALAYTRKGQHDKAFPLYRQASILGNTYAMNLCGISFLDGQGCAKSERAALYWIERAAASTSNDQIFIEAADLCSMMYAKGVGCTKNPEKADFWHRVALEKRAASRE